MHNCERTYVGRKSSFVLLTYQVKHCEWLDEAVVTRLLKENYKSVTIETSIKFQRNKTSDCGVFSVENNKRTLSSRAYCPARGVAPVTHFPDTSSFNGPRSSRLCLRHPLNRRPSSSDQLSNTCETHDTHHLLISVSALHNTTYLLHIPAF